MQRIFHIASAAAWATPGDAYSGDTLESEGFIHCSTAAQVLDVAHARFRGRRGLVLLCIDPKRVAPKIRLWGPIRLCITKVRSPWILVRPSSSSFGSTQTQSSRRATLPPSIFAGTCAGSVAGSSASRRSSCASMVPIRPTDRTATTGPMPITRAIGVMGEGSTTVGIGTEPAAVELRPVGGRLAL